MSMLGVDFPGCLLWGRQRFTSKPKKTFWCPKVSFDRIVCLLGPYKEEADIVNVSPRKEFFCLKLLCGWRGRRDSRSRAAFPRPLANQATNKWV